MMVIRNGAANGNMCDLRLVFIFVSVFGFSVASAHAETDLFTKPIDTLNFYRERPLFSPVRRASNSPVIVAPVSEPIVSQPINAVLLGVVSASDGTGLAVVRIEGQGDVQRVRVGESVNGWTLDRVESHSAIFVNDGQSVTLTFPEPGAANGAAETGDQTAPNAPVISPVMAPTPDPSAP